MVGQKHFPDAAKITLLCNKFNLVDFIVANICWIVFVRDLLESDNVHDKILLVINVSFF